MVPIRSTCVCLLSGVSLSLGLAACASGGAQDTKSPLEIAVFSPFSGPNGDYGFFEYAGCPPAVRLINADGGVLGHDLTRTIVDTAKGTDLGGQFGRLIIDLNFLYHPSCRYNDAWLCPPGNTISTPVSAGERLPGWSGSPGTQILASCLAVPLWSILLVQQHSP